MLSQGLSMKPNFKKGTKKMCEIKIDNESLSCLQAPCRSGKKIVENWSGADPTHPY